MIASTTHCRHNFVIVRFGMGLTLGLGLGQSKDIAVVILLVYNGQREIGDRHVTW